MAGRHATRLGQRRSRRFGRQRMSGSLFFNVLFVTNVLPRHTIFYDTSAPSDVEVWRPGARLARPLHAEVSPLAVPDRHSMSRPWRPQVALHHNNGTGTPRAHVSPRRCPSPNRILAGHL